MILDFFPLIFGSIVTYNMDLPMRPLTIFGLDVSDFRAENG